MTIYAQKGNKYYETFDFFYANGKLQTQVNEDKL